MSQHPQSDTDTLRALVATLEQLIVQASRTVDGLKEAIAAAETHLGEARAPVETGTAPSGVMPGSAERAAPPSGVTRGRLPGIVNPRAMLGSAAREASSDPATHGAIPGVAAKYPSPHARAREMSSPGAAGQDSVRDSAQPVVARSSASGAAVGSALPVAAAQDSAVEGVLSHAVVGDSVVGGGVPDAAARDSGVEGVLSHAVVGDSAVEGALADAQGRDSAGESMSSVGPGYAWTGVTRRVVVEQSALSDVAERRRMLGTAAHGTVPVQRAGSEVTGQRVRRARAEAAPGQDAVATSSSGTGGGEPRPPPGGPTSGR